MTTSFLDELTTDDIRGFVSPQTFARGLAYARGGHVIITTLDEDSVTAVVHGSRSEPYMVWIELIDGGAEFWIDTSCTCPVGENCKHCVATLLKATTSRGAASPARPAPPPPPSPWRQALKQIVEDDEYLGGGGDLLALEFAIFKPKATRYQSSTDPHLTVRPLRMGKKFSWVRTGAAWSELASPHYSSYRSPRSSFAPAQLTALQALAASFTNSSYYSMPATLRLDAAGPTLWPLLRRVADAGIDLIDPSGSPIRLSDVAAEPVVDLRATTNGGVHVEADLQVEESPLPMTTDRSGFIGNPPHGAWVLEHEVLRLVPFSKPLHPDMARLLRQPPLVVPHNDVDEFIDVYCPSLGRHASVASLDKSVDISPTIFTGLELTVTRPTLDRAELSWSARYERGERIILHPLRDPSGRGRDRAVERSAALGLPLQTEISPTLIDPDGMPRDLALTGSRAIHFLLEVEPRLAAVDQLSVTVTGDAPPLREATEAPRISMKVDDADTGNDWFDLAVEVSVDGEQVPFAELFAALTLEEEVLVLPSGTVVRLDRPELERLRDLIGEARGLVEREGEAVRINRFQTSWFDELASLGVVTTQSQRWLESVTSMQEIAAPTSVEPSSGLDATLRPYQQEGLDWLAFLHRHRLGGVLADDMGLGKTVQALALCLHVLEDRPDARFLVVAPTSVVENWHREAARFAPGLETCAVGETAARRGVSLVDAIGSAQLVVTSYALFRIEFDDYQELDWDVLFLDEAQFVKNHQGKTYLCARRLEARTKIAMTGTPIENGLMDLWSLLSITAPGLYPDPKRFGEVYRKPIESGREPERLATLRRRIAPLMRRRTKDEVAGELPPKVEQIVEVELSAKHTRIYERQLQRERQKVLGLVGDMNKNRFEIFRSLTLLRQLALDPGLVDPAHASVGSAKLDHLMSDLTQVVAEGHRALVFSQFTRYLALARTRLDEAGIEYAYLDGRTRNRERPISRFRDGDAPVFLISLKAGGFGLNLVEADYCFVLDPWWNPAVESQAVDRAHRIGQQNTVMVYRYVAANTIEEKVMDLKARKAALFSSVMDADGALSGAISAADIRSLFGVDD